jgi:hypothetical protein
MKKSHFIFSRLLIVVLSLLSVNTIYCSNRIIQNQPEHPLATLRPAHPRLLVTSLKDFDDLNSRITGDRFLTSANKLLQKKADKFLNEPLEQYSVVPSKYLLNVSRSILDRSYTLSMTYRLTGDKRYADRLWQELQNAARYPDWDPDHFLGTAEMTHAFAIAYDWLFDVWTNDQKAVLKAAIVEKGLTAGNLYYSHQIKALSWPDVTHNWNLVCNGAMVIGALAVADDSNKPFCEAIINNALASVPKAMNSFYPDGGWAEGPMYLTLALKYNVAMLASMQSALNTDFDLSKSPGFSGAGNFLLAVTGPSGLPFNYADGESKVVKVPELLWFANKFNQPALASYQQKRSNHNYAPEMLWYKPNAARGGTLPVDSYYRGAEVVSLRSDWNDENAWFVAFKGGNNAANHAHLDIGTFVLDRFGERFAIDVGSDTYNLPGYFGKGASSRFGYYRTSTEGHNTLVLLGDTTNNQDPKAKASITKFSGTPGNAYGIVDMTDAYGPATAISAQRGISLLQNKRVLVQDEIELRAAADVYWQIQTPANITLSQDKSTATLEVNGKQIAVQILSPAKAEFEVLDAQPLQRKLLRQALIKLGTKNDGIRRLAIHLIGVKKATVKVIFTDVNDTVDAGQYNKPLASW